MKRSYFTEEVSDYIGKTISEAEFNEVFFVGTCDEENVIYDVDVVARGNSISVPAILSSANFGQVVIHNHPSGLLTPSEQDITIASVFGNNGVGFYIINNSATEVYVVVEPFEEKEHQRLDIEDIKNSFLPEGEISKVLGDSYEFRNEQLSVVEQVISSFNNETISLIEAGTGIGKTLTYLVPAVNWSGLNNERVVISTNTINLQEQINNKDLPLLEEALEQNFNYSLVKGMRNYLCLLRAETVNEGMADLFENDEYSQVNDIIDWSKKTHDGTLSDLSFSPNDEIWDKFAAESDACLRLRCPHYSNCFFFKARREIAKSNLLIVNHHLLFSDLSIKGSVDDIDGGILPPYTRLVIDEAQHVVDSATAHFSMRSTKFGLIRTVRKLKHQSGRKKLKGLIYLAATTALKYVDDDNKKVISNILNSIEEKLSPLVDTTINDINEAFDFLFTFSSRFKEDEDNNKEIKLRLTDHLRAHDDWDRLKKEYNNLRKTLMRLYDEIKIFLDELDRFGDDNNLSKLIVEFNSVASRVYGHSGVIEMFFVEEDDANIRWIEGREGKSGILSGLGISPLDVSPHLQERLYKNCKTIVLTSATLTVDDSFEFQKKQLGLSDNERLSELIVDSPFDFKKQALLALPNDLPDPMDKEFTPSIQEVIKEAIMSSKGGVLVLFTSYSLMLLVHRALEDELIDQNLTVLKQGSIPRDKLLDKFKKINDSILFATDSFWEGIDVTGDSLNMVIITRLPFKVPTDPIIEARIEHLEKSGINSFLGYSVPIAVLKLKQGFGRLIRTKTDEGCVMILDKRILTKKYGRYFLNSLPDCKTITGNSDKVLSGMKGFLKR